MIMSYANFVFGQSRSDIKKLEKQKKALQKEMKKVIIPMLSTIREEFEKKDISHQDLLNSRGQLLEVYRSIQRATSSTVINLGKKELNPGSAFDTLLNYLRFYEIELDNFVRNKSIDEMKSLVFNTDFEEVTNLLNDIRPDLNEEDLYLAKFMAKSELSFTVMEVNIASWILRLQKDKNSELSEYLDSIIKKYQEVYILAFEKLDSEDLPELQRSKTPLDFFETKFPTHASKISGCNKSFYNLVYANFFRI